MYGDILNTGCYYQPNYLSDREENEEDMRECAYCGDFYPTSEMVQDKKTYEWILIKHIDAWVNFCKPHQTKRANNALRDKLNNQIKT